MKQSLNVFKYRYHVLRPWLVQPLFLAFFFAGPLLDVLRVDMIRQRLMFLGHAYPFEFQYLMWLPIGFYAGVLLIAVVSVLWGRIFCGWSCPHNTLTEWTRTLRAMVGREPKSPQMKRFIKQHPVIAGFLPLLSTVLAIGLTWTLSVALASWVVPMDWILAQYASGHPHIALAFGNWLFAIIGLFLLYSGHDFCRTCCPYGMGQSVSAYQEGKWRPMEIKFSGDTEANCRSCTVCQQVCPVDIDPRDPKNLRVGQFVGCFNCGECVDACKYIHSFGHKNSQAGGLLSFAPPRFGATFKTPEYTPETPAQPEPEEVLLHR